jgi:hypothetical protein
MQPTNPFGQRDFDWDQTLSNGSVALLMLEMHEDLQ